MPENTNNIQSPNDDSDRQVCPIPDHACATTLQEEFLCNADYGKSRENPTIPIREYESGQRRRDRVKVVEDS